MPVPADQYVHECGVSMATVSKKMEVIRKAVQELQGFANAETWSGAPADKWMAELKHLVKAVDACLDVKVPAAKAACLRNAQRMQTESALRVAKSKPAG